MPCSWFQTTWHMFNIYIHCNIYLKFLHTIWKRPRACSTSWMYGYGLLVSTGRSCLGRCTGTKFKLQLEQNWEKLHLLWVTSMELLTVEMGRLQGEDIPCVLDWVTEGVPPCSDHEGLPWDWFGRGKGQGTVWFWYWTKSGTWLWSWGVIHISI